MKIIVNTRLIASLLAMAVMGAALAFTSPLGQEQAAVSSNSNSPLKLPEEHGDDVTSRVSVKLSNGLLTDENGAQVRIVSYSIDFLGAGRVSLARMHGLVNFKESSSEMLTQTFIGVVPDLMSASPQLAPHSYTVYVYPKVGTTWSQVSEGDVVVNVVRTK